MARMIVVAGPPGGGKSTALGAQYFSNVEIPYFNIDERCRQLHGSAQKIPLEVRRQANDELRSFCEGNMRLGQSFAFETTLRADFAIRMALNARTVGLETEMHYVAAPVETHIDRVTARAVAGGHAASEPRLREMYSSSMNNLPKAMAAFTHSFLYDASGQELALQLEIERGQIVLAETPLASWIERGLEAFKELRRNIR